MDAIHSSSTRCAVISRTSADHVTFAALTVAAGFHPCASASATSVASSIVAFSLEVAMRAAASESWFLSMSYCT